MIKFRFSKPTIVVEVSKNPADRSEPGNPYTIFDCVCRPFKGKPGIREKYQITAPSAEQAAQMAHHFYKVDTE